MLGKIIKWAVIAVLVAAAIFALLNNEYFFKQLRYYTSQVFVTEQQRENIRRERPVVEEPSQLQIPSLDVVAPIQYVTESNEPVFQAALANGVVHYPGTAEFGAEGNSYIFGHSSDFAFSKGDYKTVFALLPKIQIGAEVSVTNKEGEKYVYRVYDKFVVESNDVKQLEQNTRGKRILTLQTSYPIGTALKRYIVKAELVKD
ncbi:sortase [bacterium]|nr:MAG: sortase [bacterium]